MNTIMLFNFFSKFRSRTHAREAVTNTELQHLVSAFSPNSSRPSTPTSSAYSSTCATRERRNDAISELYFWAVNELEGQIYEYRRPGAFVTTLLPLTQIEVEYSVLAVSTTIDAKRFAEKFILRRDLAARGIIQTSQEKYDNDVDASSVEGPSVISIYVRLVGTLIFGLCIVLFGLDSPLYWMSILLIFGLCKVLAINDLRGRIWSCLKLSKVSKWLDLDKSSTVRYSARFMQYTQASLFGMFDDEYCLLIMVGASNLVFFMLVPSPISSQFVLAALSLYATLSLVRTIVGRKKSIREQKHSLKAKAEELETDKMVMQMHAEEYWEDYWEDYEYYFGSSVNEMEV
ncbi:hypothetical protein P153DRAFT_178267 [Dothidotthia symphoricarpi CBS 119687]|uniref:Uncharacterized protein n=1 Tax=Dothidotthia symphoricarpi CBS 119687 TaxID=1392245 RepID=A0A6A6AM55_9PLEO|nr:uncharacterized protein P153DRAFT_178267 [Dothidotthia symphoricarpi CBS 119687]KAF2133019.1 hypothetical protein P153DRAFT_178267 [Dothidotthia symphoricarpi CBS 119687]